MKQILQDLKTGQIDLAEIPLQKPGRNQVLIQTVHSLVSPGTERMLLEFGRANFLNKALQQPDKVRQVLEKMKTDGIHATLNAVKSKLDQPLPLGYCNVGRVIETGTGVWEFKTGDIVVSNGGHAEAVVVDKNLVAKVPDGVDLEEASFTVLAAIALQGIRLTEPTMGERFVVLGLGLIGLITCKLLHLNGCDVIGYDFDKKKVDLAKGFGVEAFVVNDSVDPVRTVLDLTNGKGADGVIIAASTSSDIPAKQAPKMCRQRGRVTLIGVMDLHFLRSDFYQKEISFQVSCSYGPGRYDNFYERKGYDYPEGFVRWTCQRNFEAILNLMKKKQLTFSEFVEGRESFSNAKQAYAEIIEDSSKLGVVFKYDEQINNDRLISLSGSKTKVTGDIKLGVIGAGQFSSAMLIPILKTHGVFLHTLVSPGGTKAYHEGKKSGFAFISSDHEDILKNSEINAVVIATPHSSHARLVLDCLKAGKHVFVEKPLAVNSEQLSEIRDYLNSSKDSPVLMVGFNRRFSPAVKVVQKHIGNSNNPSSFVYTVNAGFIDKSHWTQDQEAGGRLVGECCHFIDTLRFLAGNKIKNASVSQPLGECRDTFSVQLGFENGSIGTIHYFSNGHKSYPKEKIQVFHSGQIIEIDNFKKVKTFGTQEIGKLSQSRQDKGHSEELAKFLDSVRSGKDCIPMDEILEVSQIAVDLYGDLS